MTVQRREGKRKKVQRRTMDGLFFLEELPSSLQDTAAGGGRGEKKKTNQSVHDPFNA